MPRPKRDFKRVNIYVPTKHYDALKKLAKIDDNNAADQVRAALHFYLKMRIDTIHANRAAGIPAGTPPIQEAIKKDAITLANMPKPKDALEH